MIQSSKRSKKKLLTRLKRCSRRQSLFSSWPFQLILKEEPYMTEAPPFAVPPGPRLNWKSCCLRDRLPRGCASSHRGLLPPPQYRRPRPCLLRQHRNRREWRSGPPRQESDRLQARVPRSQAGGEGLNTSDGPIKWTRKLAFRKASKHNIGRKESGALKKLGVP